jgi:lysozyme
VRIALSQAEFDALVDFDFNLGDGSLDSSTLLKLVNSGNFAGAADEFEKWDRAGGREVAGLLRRRQAEEALFEGTDAE